MKVIKLSQSRKLQSVMYPEIFVVVCQGIVNELWCRKHMPVKVNVRFNWDVRTAQFKIRSPVTWQLQVWTDFYKNRIPDILKHLGILGHWCCFWTFGDICPGFQNHKRGFASRVREQYWMNEWMSQVVAFNNCHSETLIGRDDLFRYFLMVFSGESN